ncbi:MAG: helix-hairpin-helix domain-containing protein [Ferruginibacter sp.]
MKNKSSYTKYLFLSITFSLLSLLVLSQTPEIPSTNTEQQMENITAGNGDVETEDDSYVQQMQEFAKHPLNLNTADENDLKSLGVLNALQIQNLINYRSLFGNFINIYELQAVPSWNIQLIQKIRLYVSVNNNIGLTNTLRERLKGGERSILLRASQTLEKSKGFIIDSSTATNFYPGSPQKILLRYKYQFKNLLQYGIVGEKDAGEQFFKGKQKQGFDFYSAHFFISNIGIIKSLALGDFTVNLGQGLTQWQSLAFKKSSDVINIKRAAAVLRPYSSAGEINFHRGAGITVGKNNWQATFFASYKKIDANLVADTSQTQDDFISSLQTSGYHRTQSETADKGIQQQLAIGGNFSYQYKRLHIGFNGIQYHFKLPLVKANDPYNLYALTGKSFGNYSMDYAYTFKNMHLFGEVAATNNLYKALVSGVLISMSQQVDMSFLYRNISKGYQSLYTTAFTESTYPSNETGFYTGLSVHPGSTWRIDAYVDMYKFPWLKFRVNAPSSGADYLLQVTYKPNKQLEIYTRFHTESKAINFNPDQFVLSPVVAQPKQNWRTECTYSPSKQYVFSSRVEALWFNKKSTAPEQGFLIYFDVLYKPLQKPFAASVRWQYFETDSYNSRLYAYENDLFI